MMRDAIKRLRQGEAVTIPAGSLRLHELPAVILAAVNANVSADTVRIMLGDLKRGHSAPHTAGVLARSLGQPAMRRILSYANTGIER